MKCRRDNFKKEERHICFSCGLVFSPGNAKTCNKCNWRIPPCGCCGCSVSKETKEALDKFYDLFCQPNNYSQETKYALGIMIKTYSDNCLRCLNG